MDQTQDVGSPSSHGGMGKVVGIVVAVLVIGALVWFAMGKKSSPSTQSEKTLETQSDEPTQTTSNKSLKDLMAAGSTVSCSFSDSGNTGTVFAANGKARTDFTSLSGGQTVA